MVQEANHSSGDEHAKGKVETSGPVTVNVELEQTVNTTQWHFNYRVYANRTHDPITARKFNFRNCLYSIRTEASACNYFL